MRETVYSNSLLIYLMSILFTSSFSPLSFPLPPHPLPRLLILSLSSSSPSPPHPLPPLLALSPLNLLPPLLILSLPSSSSPSPPHPLPPLLTLSLPPHPLPPLLTLSLPPHPPYLAVSAHRNDSVVWDAMLGLCLCTVHCAACNKVVGVAVLAANRAECVAAYVNKVLSRTSPCPGLAVVSCIVTVPFCVCVACVLSVSRDIAHYRSRAYAILAIELYGVSTTKVYVRYRTCCLPYSRPPY